MSHRPSLHVAAGVVIRPSGEVLIARRPDHLHQGGLWEFPGGKVERGETVEQALFRELAEELSITVCRAEPLISVRHAYPDRHVTLDVFRVQQFEGTPKGMLGQPVRWVRPESLTQYEFPAANRPIVTAARLPDRYGIVDVEFGDAYTVFRRLRGFIGAGVSLIRLRGLRLADRDHRKLAESIIHYCKARQTRILLSGDPEDALVLGADGVHLNSRQITQFASRPIAVNMLLAASCHNQQELKQVEAIGADFAVLSPVLATESHPDAHPLGWSAFSAMVEDVSIPVYALGGMCPEYLPVAKCHGAQGIAGIRRLVGP
jgi:8-oxo-dGTP diphosphatase